MRARPPLVPIRALVHRQAGGCKLIALVATPQAATVRACSRVVQRKSVPSTHMRCRTTASLRASATLASFTPLLFAIRIAQPRKSSLPRCREFAALGILTEHDAGAADRQGAEPQAARQAHLSKPTTNRRVRGVGVKWRRALVPRRAPDRGADIHQSKPAPENRRVLQHILLECGHSEVRAAGLRSAKCTKSLCDSPRKAVAFRRAR